MSGPSGPEVRQPRGHGLGQPAGGLIDLLPQQALEALATSNQGLTEQQVAQRLSRFGPNRIEETVKRSAIKHFVRQFIHLFAILLWVGSALALVSGLANLALAIVAVIVLNGLFGYWQEYRAERAVEALKRLLPESATVVRGGVESRVPAEGLVPGDILLLAEGDRLSADARLLNALDLRLDESSLTGESHPVHKTEMPEANWHIPVVQAHNMVFAGTTVVAGNGRAVIAATGMNREFGRIAQLTQAVPEEPSPLEREIADVARRVAILSVGMGAAFFAIGYFFAGLTPVNGAIFAIGIVIGNVPEGLLPTMTLALAMGVQRMARRNAIVKRLSSVETLGACTVICTDKTGTLTKNELTVQYVWLPGAEPVEVTGAGYSSRGRFLVNGQPLEASRLARFGLALRVGVLCNAARLRPKEQSPEEFDISGDPTEAALLLVGLKAGLDREKLLAAEPLVRQLAFDPVRKRMSTIHRSEGGGLVAYVKGAPLELLAQCRCAVVGEEPLLMSDDLRRKVVSQNDAFARQGLRVLALAYRTLPTLTEAGLASAAPGEVEQDMVFLGLAAMQDPPRPEVPAAVQQCQAAGIRIIMITGDYGLTAESIARQVGIVDRQTPRVVESRELESMPTEELKSILREEQPIFARATPEHKLRVVMALRELGEVVAVTGDGVNDAPALKQADIGVAMGLCGTDVAREAADMILTDDNFASIVSAIEEGRAIFDNMRKFIVYIFAHLTPEAVPFILFALFHVPLPLTVMQILAIDLGTETLPALALGMELPEPDVMSRPPRRRGERLLNGPALLRGYGFLGLLTTAAVMTAFFTYLSSEGWLWGQTAPIRPEIASTATAVVFLGIVILQIGNAFACRTERASAFSRGLLGNRLLLAGIGFELLLAACLIYVPILQPVFGTGPLGARWWLLLFACVPPVFLLEEGRKLLARRLTKSGC